MKYTSPEGEFSVTFPAGCGRLYTKMNGMPGARADVDVRLVFVNCERDRVNHEGCQVNARLGAARELKGKAATDMVLAEVRKLLDGYGVVPARQTAGARRLRRPRAWSRGSRSWPTRNRAPATSGSAACLRGDDVYFLIAWKANGGLTEDPGYDGVLPVVPAVGGVKRPTPPTYLVNF